jgi:hypothetical protein
MVLFGLSDATGVFGALAGLGPPGLTISILLNPVYVRTQGLSQR